MKHYLFVIGLVFLAFIGNGNLLYAQKMHQQDREKHGLKIHQKHLELKIGERIELQATFYDSIAIEVGENCDWLVLPDSIGQFDGNVLLAKNHGNGYVIASYMEFSDTIKFVVEADNHENNEAGDTDEMGSDDEHMQGKNKPYIRFRHEKHIALEVGDSVLIEPVYYALNDSIVEVEFTWIVDPGKLGSISSHGLFVAQMEGEGFIVVKYGDVKGLQKIVVKDSGNEKEWDDQENDGDKEYPRIRFRHNERITMEIGDSMSFAPKCYAAADSLIEVEYSWLVDPGKIGTINSDGLFVATAAGEGVVVAKYGDTKGVQKIKIKSQGDEVSEEDDKGDGEKGKGKKYPSIQFEMKHLKLNVGESEQLKAVYYSAKNKTEEISFEWKVVPSLLGTVSSDGKFTAEMSGNGYIEVSGEGINARLRFLVKNKEEKRSNYTNSLHIVTRKVELEIGEEVELMAVYYDAEGLKEQVNALWTVDPDSLGSFNDSLFFAAAAGKGYIYAQFDTLQAKVSLAIKNSAENDDDGNQEEQHKIKLSPEDTSVVIGSTIQYSISRVDNGNEFSLANENESDEIEWFIVGNKIGEINQDGLLTVTQPGVGVVKAKINGKRAVTTRVIVTESFDDSVTVNTVEVFRVLPNGNILPSKTITEGSAFKIGGMPFPLNVLNGGLIHFPVGSLEEDIKLYLMLPEQIQEDSLDVVYLDSVVAGVKFVVTVDDVAVDPYYFAIPLNLSIPYNLSLMDSLNISADLIGMFFSESGSYEESGITDISIDSVGNRILANVEHFSTLVVKGKPAMQTGIDGVNNRVGDIHSFSNYPNPFSIETWFKIKTNEPGNGVIEIIDLQGRRLKTISVASRNEIHWDGTDEHGNKLVPGFYVAFFKKENRIIQNCRILIQ